MAQIIHCDSHGQGEWKGHIVCGACGILYMMEDAPEVCAGCGRRLLPEGDRSDFTARIVCGDCADRLGGAERSKRDRHAAQAASCSGSRPSGTESRGADSAQSAATSAAPR